MTNGELALLLIVGRLMREQLRGRLHGDNADAEVLEKLRPLEAALAPFEPARVCAHGYDEHEPCYECRPGKR